jgi:hypothetical protein
MKSDWLDHYMPEAIDGTLSDAERRRFEAKLAEDPAARARFNELRELAASIEALPGSEPPVDFTESVMAQIRDIRHPWWVRPWRFLMRPHEIRFNLLGAMTATAGIAAVVVLGVQLLRQEGMPQPPSAGVQKEYLMRFSYIDPHARQVYVAGSFNDWRKQQIPLTDSSGKGLWSGILPMKPGIYEYMFYVDGHWVEDAHAQRHKDDGFGRKNAILELGTGDDSSI